MALLELRGITLAFGGPNILDMLDLRIEPKERVCLLGRNGSGKTSLLSIAAGLRPPDAGERTLARGAAVGFLPQDVPAGLSGSVRRIIQESRLHAAEWQNDLHIERILAEMQLDGEAESAMLSAGQKRRVLLARALSGRPDLLMLDEPTNHLDLPSIAWLEQYLARWSGAMLFVTHDRAFLRRFARRIIELDRGRLLDWTCGYDDWIERKESFLETQEARDRVFDKSLAAEEQWLRQGIKARRTRNEGRVRRLVEWRRQRAERRQREGAVRLQINTESKTGKLVAAVRGLCLQRDGKVLFSDLDLTVMRGDRVGIIGPNGAGKTSFLQVLLGGLAPDKGEVVLGANVQAAYFDQLRATLDPDRSVRWNVAQGLDVVTIQGRTRHVIGYLSDFLFMPERAAQPVRSLSGGERNRLLLARLFARPANVLVLDEPTNDLDLETLDLLEGLLAAYPGTVLLVSHDRQFLDNVVTSTLVFDGRGGAQEFVGGFTDWERQGGGWSSLQRARSMDDGGSSNRGGDGGPDTAASALTDREGGSRPKARKLRWREERELEALPERIEELEKEQVALYALLADPAHYRDGARQIASARDRLRQVASDLEQSYARWEELEHRSGSE